MTLVYLGIAWIAGITWAIQPTSPPGWFGWAILMPLIGLVLWRESHPPRSPAIRRLPLLPGARHDTLARALFGEQSPLTDNDQRRNALACVVVYKCTMRTNLRLQAEMLPLEHDLPQQAHNLAHTPPHPTLQAA